MLHSEWFNELCLYCNLFTGYFQEKGRHTELTFTPTTKQLNAMEMLKENEKIDPIWNAVDENSISFGWFACVGSLIRHRIRQFHFNWFEIFWWAFEKVADVEISKVDWVFHVFASLLSNLLGRFNISLIFRKICFFRLNYTLKVLLAHWINPRFLWKINEILANCAAKRRQTYLLLSGCS